MRARHGKVKQKDDFSTQDSVEQSNQTNQSNPANIAPLRPGSRLARFRAKPWE
jgi:hypothetical protein